MKALLLCVILALTGTFRCHARIGENLQQCIARYGEPGLPRGSIPLENGEEKSAEFHKNGYVITETYLNGIVEAEVFMKSDNSAFSEMEKSTILQADSGNEQWFRSKDASLDEIWDRNDGDRAIYSHFDHTLVILTKKFIAKRQAEEEADQKNKLKDF